MVNVTGEHLGQIQAPKIIMSADGFTFSEACTVKTDTLMMCAILNVSSPLNRSRWAAGTENEDAGFTVGFRLANLFLEPDELGRFTYVTDPVFNRFEGDDAIQDLEGSKLQIAVSSNLFHLFSFHWCCQF